jgi:hypothetical protein
MAIKVTPTTGYAAAGGFVVGAAAESAREVIQAKRAGDSVHFRPKKILAVGAGTAAVAAAATTGFGRDGQELSVLQRVGNRLPWLKGESPYEATIWTGYGAGPGDLGPTSSEG